MVLRIESFVKTALWAILALSASAACVDAALLLRVARLRRDAVAGQVEGLVRPTQQLEANWNAVAVTSSQVLAKERSAFDDQERYYAKLANDTDAVFAAVTGTMFPKAAKVLDSTDAAVESLSDSGKRLVDSGDLALEKVPPLLDALTTRASDPHLTETIQNAQEVTANLAAISESGKNVAAHYEKLILAPASKVKAGILFAASVAGRVLRIF